MHLRYVIRRRYMTFLAKGEKSGGTDFVASPSCFVSRGHWHLRMQELILLFFFLSRLISQNSCFWGILIFICLFYFSDIVLPVLCLLLFSSIVFVWSYLSSESRSFISMFCPTAFVLVYSLYCFVIISALHDVYPNFFGDDIGSGSLWGVMNKLKPLTLLNGQMRQLREVEGTCRRGFCYLASCCSVYSGKK